MREQFHVIYVFFRGGGRDWVAWSWSLLFRDLFIQSYSKGNTLNVSERLQILSSIQKRHVSPPYIKKTYTVYIEFYIMH